MTDIVEIVLSALMVASLFGVLLILFVIIIGKILDLLQGRETSPFLPEMHCSIPPYGWYCTRQQGHEGPCAAHPIF